jgi:N-acetylmuramoyl-L-alanine amidase
MRIAILVSVSVFALSACTAGQSSGVAFTGTAAPARTTTSALAPTTSTTTTTTTPALDIAKIAAPPADKPATAAPLALSAAAADDRPMAVRTPTGVLGLRLGVEDGGTRIRTPCSREAVVKNAEIVGAVDVVLDPGHGGIDPGASSRNGLTEAKLNLDVALRTRDLLVARGFTVAMTRDGDWFRTIADRAELSEAIRPRAFVSIHHNSGVDAPRNDGPGSELYYERDEPESQRLGGVVWEEITGALSTFNIKWTSSSRRGVRWRADKDGDDFYGVLRRAYQTPAVIVEGAYMSASAESDLMETAEFRAVEAAGIARGIERWLTTSDPGSGFRPGFVEGGVARVPNMAKCRDPKLE